MMHERRRYFAAGVIVRRTKKGYRFLVQVSEETKGPTAGKKQLKFPGGMDSLKDNGNPEKTLRSEIEEETGYFIKDEASPVLLFSDKTGDIDKYFYLVHKGDCVGTRRKKLVRDGSTILYPPVWADLEYIRGRLHPTHLPVLRCLPTGGLTS